jgi:hypothetical protein
MLAVRSSRGVSLAGGGLAGAGDLPQLCFDFMLPLRVGDFFTVRVADIKTVDRAALFGEDFGQGNIETQVGEDGGHGEEETEPVLGLDFNDGALIGSMVVELDSERDDLAVQGLIERAGGDAARDERGEVDIALGEGFEEQGFETVAVLAADESAGLGGGDEERVEDDVVLPGEDLGAEDVDARGAERAGNGAEKAGTIPGANGGARAPRRCPFRPSGP